MLSKRNCFLVLCTVVVLSALLASALGTERNTRALARLKQQMKAKVSLSTLDNVGVSAEAKDSLEVQAILNSPDVQAAMNAQTPDAVDRLIQGILEGKGSGGVVTTEFNQGGVHATIISNVNELRVTQVDNSKEERKKAADEDASKKQLRAAKKQAHEENKKQNILQKKRMQVENSEASENSERSEQSEASQKELSERSERSE